MTLVKSLHSGDPDVIQNIRACKYLGSRGKELASAIWVTAIEKAYYLLAYIRACAPGISPCVTATCTGAAMYVCSIGSK
jgi:hypothetical protein